jgi:putative glutamine amidotransferase
MAEKPLRIGLSACFFHADPKRPIFKGKTLQYLEQSIARWVLSEGVLLYMIPSPADGGRVGIRDYVADLDGLVLQGGSDVCPASYGEEPLKPEWNGDRVRDLYESELVRAFGAAGKPVLGICRGLQLVNVALGGTLIQDIGTQLPAARVHRDWEIYDQLFHDVVFESGSLLGKLAGKPKGRVNSVHHQAIARLAPGLAVEAKCPEDGMVEAVRGTGSSWLYAVQWHPEFQNPSDASLLDARPLLREFLKEAQNAQGH